MGTVMKTRGVDQSESACYRVSLFEERGEEIGNERDGRTGGNSDGDSLLVNGTLALRRARDVATLLRVEETAAPRDAPRLETRDTWESLRDTCLIHDS